MPWPCRAEYTKKDCIDEQWKTLFPLNISMVSDQKAISLHRALGDHFDQGRLHTLVDPNNRSISNLYALNA